MLLQSPLILDIILKEARWAPILWRILEAIASEIEGGWTWHLVVKVIKSVIPQAAVSNFILEDQIRVIPARMADIKTQASKHEVTIWFLEPTEFEIIVSDVVAWKQFIT